MSAEPAQMDEEQDEQEEEEEEEQEQEPVCTYCAQGKRHPLFMYLLSDKRHINNPQNHVVVPYVGLSSHPLWHVRAHNREPGLHPACQLTKPGSPHYQVEMVCGPFVNGTGRKFKVKIRKECRKLRSRMLHFAMFAHKMQKRFPNFSLYARDPDMLYRLLQEELARKQGNQH